MHINITKSECGNNRGSSRQLVAYLEKENRLQRSSGRSGGGELWFSHDSMEIQPYQVRYDIDRNVGRLSRDEAKFFLVNISPSEHELRFLQQRYGNRGAREKLKEYSNSVMDGYARNFKKERVRGKEDLVYFGKLERSRYYTFRDQEVKDGLARRGDPKPGRQMHVQVIVSRKDVTDSVRLSPMNNSRGSNSEHSLKVGQFDRSAFKQLAEEAFDRSFGYQRELWETFRFANALKNGSDMDKREMLKALEREREMLEEGRKKAEQHRSRVNEQDRGLGI